MAESNTPHVEPDLFAAHGDADISAPRHGVLSKFETYVSVFAVAEAASVILAALVAKLVYIDMFFDYGPSAGPYLIPAFLLALTLYLTLKQAGLYDASALVEPVVGYGKLWGALAMSFLVVLGMLYIVKEAEIYSRGWFLTWFALSAVALVVVRLAVMRRVRRLVAEGHLRQRVALFGTLEFITAMKTQIEAASPLMAVDGLFLAKPATFRSDDILPDGGLNDLKQALARREYDTVVIGLPPTETKHIQAAVGGLASYSTELMLCTELDQYPVAINGSRNFGTLRANIVNLVPHSERNWLTKTILDYTVASVGLVLLAPLFALVAAAIKLESPGPVFFRQRRYGQNNRVFRIYKFRTMAVAEDGAEVKQAERNDPRVTGVGRLLRRTSFDELPQLLNVLAGDMSIVGPRPHALAHDQLFEQQLDLFSRRRRVRPGLTGWAQVHGFRGETKTTEDIKSRMQHDLYYIENWSIWFDIEIVTRTVFVLFRGAY
jgi:putative colanic acid biosynthesis UDP-glucose lipid carrier transferase